MRDAEEDPVLQRAIEELRRLPDVDAEKMKRVVLAAAAARIAPSDEDVLIDVPRRSTSGRVWGAAALIAAAAIVGFVARGVWMPRVKAAPSSSVATTNIGPVRAVSTHASDAAALPQQFVFRNGTAHRVSVVGDFNSWNPASARLTRSSDGTEWSTIIPILPGRHLYGFMIDDSLFVLDPHAPKAHDPDLGSEGSVVIVGRP